MRKDAYLDTHVALRLTRGRTLRLSRRALSVIESHQILLSPAVELELAFLNEIGRVKITSEEILRYLRASIGLQVCELPFAQVVFASSSLSWTRDVFDRLIVGQAIANGEAPLITLDNLIHKHYKGALS